MSDWDMARWEARDNAAARRRMTGYQRGARQIDQSVKERTPALQRIAFEERMAAEADTPGQSQRMPRRRAVSLLVGFGSIMLRLVAR